MRLQRAISRNLDSQFDIPGQSLCYLFVSRSLSAQTSADGFDIDAVDPIAAIVNLIARADAEEDEEPNTADVFELLCSLAQCSEAWRGRLTPAQVRYCRLRATALSVSLTFRWRFVVQYIARFILRIMFVCSFVA